MMGWLASALYQSTDWGQLGLPNGGLVWRAFDANWPLQSPSKHLDPFYDAQDRALRYPPEPRHHSWKRGVWA